MKEYEITYTYLNGCAGAAYPLTSFEEAELQDPADYIRQKHSHDYQSFTREEPEEGRILYRFDNGAVCHIYEFNEL